MVLWLSSFFQILISFRNSFCNLFKKTYSEDLLVSLLYAQRFHKTRKAHSGWNTPSSSWHWSFPVGQRDMVIIKDLKYKLFLNNENLVFINISQFTLLKIEFDNCDWEKTMNVIWQIDLEMEVQKHLITPLLHVICGNHFLKATLNCSW